MNISERAINKTRETMNRYDIKRTIRYFKPTESEITRDRFNDIASRGLAYVDMTAFPCILSPSQKQRDRAGMLEHINAIFYISKQDYEEKINKRLSDIIRHRVHLITDSIERPFDINTAHYDGDTTDDYRYVILGCVDSSNSI